MTTVRADDAIDASLRIVARTADYAVVDKPAGLLSVRGRGEARQDSVQSRAAGAFLDATGPLIVHRLDMETSGLLVLALTPDAHRALSRQFMERRTTKLYEALVTGDIPGDGGEIALPIAADWPNRPRQVVDRERGRPARTIYRVLAREGGRTRLELQPVTGRTHQLRVHAAAARDIGGLGCPIVGDSLYGGAPGPRLMLHARTLEFIDPGTGERARFESPTPF